MPELREQLEATESRLSALREEKQRAVTVAKAAKAAHEAVPDDSDDRPQFEAAMAANDAVKSIDLNIREIQEEQSTLLRRLADAEAGRSGFASPGVNGWEVAARKLDLAGGELRADVEAQSLLAGPALPPTPSSPVSPLRTRAANGASETDVPTSNRWLYPVFTQQPFGGSSADLVTTDFVITFANDELTGGLTPEIEREPDSTSQKATMTPTVALAYPQAKQYAAILDAIPAKIFDSQEAVRALLGTELARQLSERFDAACVDALEAATPPHGSTGSDLVSRIRNGISAMADLGGEPSVIALSPSDAASLDLADDGSGAYLFIPDTTSQAVVWRLLVRESPTISAPTLIDPSRLGVSYLGEGSVLLNPYDGMDVNTVKARVEIEGLALHVRCAQQGAYRLVA
jgi:hypothetical protein